MNAFVTEFSSPLVRALGWALVHSLWQGALVACLLALGLRTVPASAHRYWLALAALGLLVVSVGATATYVYEPTPTAPTFAVRYSAMPSPPLDAPSTRATATWTAQAEGWFPYLVAAWALGTGLGTLRLAGSCAYLYRLQRAPSQPLSPAWEARLRALQERWQMRRRVRVRVSAHVRTPGVIGHWRPLILLPASVLTGLSPDQLEAVLLHELAHIRRHDYLVNILQSVVEALFFYHPACWWIARQIRLEREVCCDQQAVGQGTSPLTLARALTQLAAPAPTLMPAASGSTLRLRILRLVQPQTHQAGPLTARWLGSLLLLALLAGLLFSAPQMPARPNTRVAMPHLLSPFWPRALAALPDTCADPSGIVIMNVCPESTSSLSADTGQAAPWPTIIRTDDTTLVLLRDTITIWQAGTNVHIVTVAGLADTLPPTAPRPPRPPRVGKVPMPPIPPTPPVHFDMSDEEFDAAMDEYHDQMRAYRQEMKAFEQEMEVFCKEMKAFSKEEIKAFEQEMEAFGKEMAVFALEMARMGKDIALHVGAEVDEQLSRSLPPKGSARTQSVLGQIEKALVDDGLIESGAAYRLQLTADQLVVNGEIQPARRHHAYKKLYEKASGQSVAPDSELHISKKSDH